MLLKILTQTQKLATSATKAELKAELDNIVKFQVLDLSYFHCKIFLVMIVFKVRLFDLDLKLLSYLT